jgi:dTDP-4-amino-4,6-dideoxygalactose transaminase
MGYNYRMDELSAALGCAQVQRLSELLAKRAAVAGWYNERLGNFDLVTIPEIAQHTSRMSWFVYVVRLAEGVDRERLILALNNLGVPSRPYFTPIHLQPFYRRAFDYRAGDFQVAEALGKSCLALPFSGVMTQNEVDYVCDTLVKVLAACSVRTPASTAAEPPL